MLGSPADALVDLLEGSKGLPCKITGSSRAIVRLSNGIKYYAVEVTSQDGVQYGITAYDHEADELLKVAMRSKNQLPLLTC